MVPNVIYKIPFRYSGLFPTSEWVPGSGFCFFFVLEIIYSQKGFKSNGKLNAMEEIIHYLLAKLIMTLFAEPEYTVNKSLIIK